MVIACLDCDDSLAEFCRAPPCSNKRVRNRMDWEAMGSNGRYP